MVKSRKMAIKDSIITYWKPLLFEVRGSCALKIKGLLAVIVSPDDNRIFASACARFNRSSGV